MDLLINQNLKRQKRKLIKKLICKFAFKLKITTWKTEYTLNSILAKVQF
jgi:hypothetical protein